MPVSDATLVRGILGGDPQYFGDGVQPGDAESILMQWPLEDGRTRIVYGDLETETLP